MMTRLFEAAAAMFGADGQAPALLPLLADVALKGAVILLAALLLNRLLQRAAAATRHLVWTLALISLLVLPAVQQIIPVWQLPLPAALRPFTLAVPTVTVPPALGIADAKITELAAAAAELPQPAANQVTVNESGVAPPPKKAEWLTGPRLILLIWLAGVLAVLTRLGRSLLGARRITQTAAFVMDYGWNAALKRLSAQLRLREHVPLLCSDEVAMPMTCGVIYPVVLVPPEAGHWSEEWRQVVLLHELAHIKRRDCLTQLLAQVACAFYWFNPLVWLAARRLREERELACDDCVLGVGTRASAYASYLLELARPTVSNKAFAIPAAVGIGCSQLESRVRAILDPAIKRRGLTCGLASLAVMGALGLLLPLAALQPTTRAEELAPLPAVKAGALATVAAELGLTGSSVQASETKQGEAAAAKEGRATPVTQAEDADTHEQNNDNPDPNPNPNPNRGQDTSKSKTATSSQELTAEAIIQMKMYDVTPEYIEMLRKQGYDNLSVRQVTQLKMHDVNETFIQEARNLGGDKLSVQDLVQLKVAGVTPEYVRVMKQAGYGESLRSLSQMRLQGVTPEYIEMLRKQGYSNLTADQVTQLKIQGVNEAYIQEVRNWGSDKLSVQDLVQLKVSGVTPEYVRVMKQAGYNESLRSLSQMSLQGVTPEYIESLRKLGYSNLTANQLTQLKIHGVNESYVNALRSAGFNNLSIEELTQASIHGLSPEYINEMRRAGYDKLTLKEWTQMRMHGVSSAYIKEMRDLGFDKLTASELTRLKMYGVTADYIRKMRAAGLKNISLNDLLKLKMNGIDEILLKK